MRPWIHPQDRRTRIFLFVQIAGASIAAIAIPVMLVVLQEPTRDHIILSIVMPIIGITAVVLGIRALRKLPDEFRTEPEAEGDTTTSPGERP